MVEYNGFGTQPKPELAMPSEKYTIARIGELGKKIYQEQIKRLVEPRESGKFIVIDVESGDFEVDREHLAASRRLWERHPDSVRYATIVGNLAAYHIGWDAPSAQEEKFTVPHGKYTVDEICDRGEKIYEEQIKHLVEPRENGKFIAIDIESGDYEIDEDDIAAEDRLNARRPGFEGFLGMVGYEAAFTVGWGGGYIDDFGES